MSALAHGVCKPSSGRKLQFDRQVALDAAMQVFWKKGFAAASLSELTAAMGINKPSLYATFGNKEALFVQATENYVAYIDAKHRQFLHEPGQTLKSRLHNYLRSVIAGQCASDNPKGCYLALCMAEAEGEALPDAALVSISTASQHAYRALVTLFSEDREAKSLGLDREAALNARFLITMLSGTAAMARAGNSVDELEPLLAKAFVAIGL
jgi:TetR/AcrR family transcriptional regulator, copper-responsive repressor